MVRKSEGCLTMNGVGTENNPIGMGDEITSRFRISALSPESPYLLHPCSRHLPPVFA